MEKITVSDMDLKELHNMFLRVYNKEITPNEAIYELVGLEGKKVT